MMHIRPTRRLAPLLAPAIVAAALGCREDAESPTAPAPEPALATRRTDVLLFHQVSGGVFHTCGVTIANVAYCWGDNTFGQLGNGSRIDSPTPVPVVGPS